MAEYVSLLPPNSHGEANPADKDPVPPPFDNTYNSPEHDAFVLKVKYQRNDAFFTDNLVDGADRARLNQAWNDLLRIVAVSRRVSRHAHRSLRPDAEEPPDPGPGRRADRGAACGRQTAREIAAGELRRGDRAR